MSNDQYRIVVQGQLGERFAEAFDDMTQAPHGRDTVLQGPFTDRSQLDGVSASKSKASTEPGGSDERKSNDR